MAMYLAYREDEKADFLEGSIPDRELPLDEQRMILVREIQSIEAQLSDQNRIDPDTGARMDSEDFWSWRHRAIKAKTYKVARLKEVKMAIHKQSGANNGMLARRMDMIEEKLDIILGLLAGEKA